MLDNLRIFGRRSKDLLGVDISSSAVKIVKLSSGGGSYKLDNYIIRPLPAKSVVEKNIVEVNAVGEAIASAISLMKPNTKDAAIAVAGSAVITKTIEMNAALNDNELENQIIVEADQYIPYPLDEVAIDFERQAISARSDDLVEVLLAACRRENVDSRVLALELGGLEPRVVDIEAYAIERAYSLIEQQLGSDHDQTTAIIDVGASMTTLNVMLEGKTLYNREQMFGGDQLVDDIVRRFGLTKSEAELALKRGGLPEEFEAELLLPFTNLAVEQITKTLQFFFSSSQYNDVDRIVLAGGVAALPGLAALVQEQLSTPASIANPFLDLEIGAKVNKTMLNNDAPALLIATGLAMRSVN